MFRRIQLSFVSLAVLGLLAACGGETGLTVRGSVEVVGADATELSTGFNFPDDTRIDDVEASAEGRLTGLCEMRQVRSDIAPEGEDVWGVILELHRGGTVADEGLASLTVMQRTDSAADEGRIEAELGTTLYTSGVSGTCSVEIPYAVRDSGMVGLSGHCDIEDADGNPATVDLQLDIIGCTVAE